jgi:prepilin-type N-terminal cleavage/methylation domain-containing protein
MKNEKGFTLIELLAVIIILGILMLVAIPSVTTYINSSRKSAYVDTAQQYIKAAVNVVNQGKKVQFYDEKTLLLMPVGHNEKRSMVTLESGGQSPYNSTWYFAYVGVTYNNESYDYYFTGVDQSGQGIKMVKQDGLEKGAEDLVLAGLKSTSNLTYTAKLAGLYSGKVDKLYSSSCGTDEENCNALTDLFNSASDDTSVLLPAGVTKVIVCGSDKCNLTLTEE